MHSQVDSKDKELETLSNRSHKLKISEKKKPKKVKFYIQSESDEEEEYD